jgi:competence protein ComEA
MKSLWAIVFAVLFGLFSGGILFLSTRSPRGEPVELAPPPTQAPVVVFVTGAVHNPGLYSLPPGSRRQHAIHAAGGLLPEANETSLNLADLLKDGERIYVALKNPHLINPEVSTNLDSEFTFSPVGQSGNPQLININTAGQSELELLPGIGPALAGRIIQYRLENGYFGEIEEVLKVSGIGEKKFEQIQDLITVDWIEYLESIPTPTP